MGLNNLSKLKFCVLVRIKILIFAFVVESVLLANTTRYEACTPGNCGTGPNIRFPFYISGARPDYCGYPGYAVVCNQAKPTYRNSKGQYIIQDIFYENQTFRLVDQEFDNDSCFAPRYNFSFDLSSPEFAPNNAYLLFFYNCSSSFSVGYAKSLVSCASSATNSSFVALVHQDLGLNGNRVACESFVAAPVELEGGYSNQTIENVDYVTLLKDGFKLKWIRSYNCAECQRNGGRCGFENEEIVCYCPDDRNHKKYCYKDNKRIKMVVGLSIGCSLILIIACCCFFIRRHYKKKYASSMLARNISSRSDMEGGSFYFGASVFSYSELKEATNNFDLEKELGDGGFGTVYYGKLRDGREVAVKKLYEHNYRRVEQFMNEIEILTQLRHKNLVSLYGCTSRHSRELLLVYEYIPNGTVADHIHGDRATPGSPTWPTRLSIAIETASALAYLHASDIIHRDVKTNNILLDNSFCVKVADFGLSRLFPTNVTHVSTAPQGTPGYVDPEYHQCYQLTIKSDVYSFGVVLIELISSLPAVDITRHRHEINLANLAITKIQNCEFNELIDQHLGFESDNEVKRMTIAVANLAFQCLQPDKETRPSMKEVLEALKKIQSGKDGSEDREKADDDAGVLKPQTSLDSDEIGLLKNTRLPPSPNSVTDQWTSRSTTPNDSGNGVKFASI